VSSQDGSDICRNTFASVFQSVRTAMAIERSANFSDKVTEC